jgi:hypothetical protein
MQPSFGPLTRRYRSHWWLRLFALGFFAFSCTGSIHIWLEFVSADHAASRFALDIWTCLALVGFTLSVHFFTATVTLEWDRIELRYFLSCKRLFFSEIRGRREYMMTDSDGVKTRYIVLEPHDQSKPRLEFRRIYNFDSAFETWLRGFPIIDR